MPFGPGTIGITSAPGHAELDAIASWGAAAVVTLVEQHELEALGITWLGAEVRRRRMAWHHWPVQDYAIPDAAFEAAWPNRSAALRHALSAGGRVLIHCRGGLGRSGIIAARLLVEHGMPPETAIPAVRAARPGAIETPAQEAWVRAGAIAVATNPGCPANVALGLSASLPVTQLD